MAFYEKTYHVELRDTGKSNTLTNRGFLSYMEDLGGLHSEDAGYGLNDIERTHLSWFLLAWNLRIFRRPKYAENIRIVTWGKSFSRVQAVRDFEIYDEENNLIAIASSKWALYDIYTNKLGRISQDLIDSYTYESKSAFGNEEINFSININLPEKCKNTYEYTILRKNIDINNHVHNLYYLDLALETLPEDVYQNCDFNNLEIIYKKECSLGDKIKCEYYFVDDCHYVYVKNYDGSTLHTIIKLS